ncbi:MAG: crotonase/enoyl-CoA hydratase family protein [Alteraurantiacibacter sp. bin_em_oilr2.035]|nr:crotonase/enoyl-CoA hydratase family protein [Aurantiacibacter atlanticus]MDF1834225.1 crotonase/enoyl-CoA hydratase family protein [Alteraurantiacibacter sp. bin_em_oilr2.035]
MGDEQVVTREIRDNLAIITLNRPEKRNALAKSIFVGLQEAFTDIPESVDVVILTGNGDHFCAGLDLAEYKMSPAYEGMLYSRWGHKLFDSIQYCGRPVIAAMHGAVIGGGLELASCAHIRIADQTTFYQLPEGRRGIFLGGGGTVRIARLIGVGRLTEIMLTGRRIEVDKGEQLGLSHYVVEPGKSMETALEIAENVAANAKISNYMMLNALSMIEDMPAQAGLFTEAVAQALTLTSPDAQKGIDAFLTRNK